MYREIQGPALSPVYPFLVLERCAGVWGDTGRYRQM